MVDIHDTQCYDGSCYSPLITLKGGIFKMAVSYHSQTETVNASPSPQDELQVT